MVVRLQHKPEELIGPGKDQYKVLELIKSGGMGSVYKVEKFITGNLFAVKECDVLDDPRKKQISREEALRGFRHEGKLLESLNHPGIPRGFLLLDSEVDLRICLNCGNPVDEQLASCDLCKHSASSFYYRPQRIEERYYLFMEFIEGQDINEYSAGLARPLSGENLENLLASMAELAEVLAFIHDKDLVHRDVKPENLRISSRDGRLYLLDYGLLSETSASGDPLSATNKLGTQGFASPEQGRGEFSTASDIYAAALTFLALATGIDPTNPVNKDHILKTGPVQLLPDLSMEITDLIRLSLADASEMRPSAQDWQDSLANYSRRGTARPRPVQTTRTTPPSSAAQTQVLPGPGSRQVTVKAPPSQQGTSQQTSRTPQPVATPAATPAQAAQPGTGNRVGLFAGVALLIVFLGMWFGGFFGQTGDMLEYVARPNASIFVKPGGEFIRNLENREHLMAAPIDKEKYPGVKGSWLRVHKINDKSQKAYIPRNSVDTI